jgi:Tfp pilus assembly protein PilO
MKKSLQKLQLGGIFSLVILGFAFWYFLLAPQMTVPELRKVEAEQLGEVHKVKSVDLLDLLAIEANSSKEQSQAETLNVKIPAALEQYLLAEQLISIISGTGITPRAIDVAISGSMAPFSSESITASNLFSVNIVITVQSSLPSALVEYANSLHNAPRAITISSMNITSPSEGNQSYLLTVQGTIYAAPKIDIEPVKRNVMVEEETS